MEWWKEHQFNTYQQKEWRKKVKKSKPFTTRQEINDKYFKKHIKKQKQNAVMRMMLIIIGIGIGYNYLFTKYVNIDKEYENRQLSILEKIIFKSKLIDQIINMRASESDEEDENFKIE